MSDPRSRQIMRCERCGDVIGAYEPMIVANVGTVRQTSGAAEPGIQGGPGRRYHRACYEKVPAGDERRG